MRCDGFFLVAGGRGCTDYSLAVLQGVQNGRLENGVLALGLFFFTLTRGWWGERGRGDKIDG